MRKITKIQGTSGEVFEICDEFARNKINKTFINTVEELKNNDYSIGDVVETLGYYAPNDGGSSLYQITDTLDTNKYQEQLNNNLYATLIPINNTINIMQLGLKDNTEFCNDKINKALSIVDNVELNPIEYKYKLETYEDHIMMHNNNILNGNGALIKVDTPHNLEEYSIIFCDHISNVIIKNITIDANKTINSASSGEWGYCINIRGSQNIFVNNCELYNAWGDGIKIENQEMGIYRDNIAYIDGCKIHDCRRQGISIVDCKKAIIKNSHIYNIKGTDPQSGIDLEPFFAKEKIENVSIINNEFNNIETAAIMATKLEINSAKYNANILIKGNKIHDTSMGINLTLSKTTNVNTIIKNNYFDKITYQFLMLENHTLNNSTLFDNVISNCILPSSYEYCSFVFKNSPDTPDPIGNIDIKANFINVTSNDEKIINLKGITKISNTNVKIVGNKNAGIYEWTSFDSSCNIDLTQNISQYNYAPILNNPYAYYRNVRLKGGSNDYIISDNYHLKTKVIKYGTPGSNIKLTLPGGKVWPINNNQSMSSTTDNAIAEFFIDDNGEVIVTELYGNWS